MNFIKKLIKFIFGLILFIIICGSIFLGLGYAAIRWNFWPPTCNILPIYQAKRVCEFSKLDSVPAGQNAIYTFFVTVPSNTPKEKSIKLAIDGHEPYLLDKINDLSWQKIITLKTGETINYKYLLSDDSTSNLKTIKITRLAKNIYDWVDGFSNQAQPQKLSSTLEPGVSMMDTWGINYNMNFFENTRWNFAESIRRIKAMDAKEIGVYSFIDITGTKNNFTVSQINTDYKYFRDASISLNDMKMIAKEAHDNKIKVAIHYNINADYSKFVSLNPASFQVGTGTGGNTAETKAGQAIGRDEPKDELYVDRYMSQLQNILVNWAKNAQEAGIDIIDITPQYRPPKWIGQNEYADQKMIEMIAAMRKVFQGKIFASNFGQYGAFDGDYIPKYINDADGLYLYFGYVKINNNPSIDEIKNAYKQVINNFANQYINYKKPLVLVSSISSYDEFLNGKEGMEFNDFTEMDRAGYKPDWQEQADGYEGLLQAMVGENRFTGFQTSGYWYDDLMAPEYMGPRNNMHSTIRNKPAEAVWQKWFSQKDQN